jgi:imidazole glycerol phosphate synthase glutamine amidotransferase subunit
VNVTVCDYGAGNVRSVTHAFERLGARVRPDGAAEADLTVVPGVGSAAAAMRGLQERGLDTVLHERVRDGRPVLGICLGLQIALESSEEDGGVPGLGIVPGRAVRLTRGRVPRIGWAAVEPYGTAFYFAHSYAAETPAATAFSEGIVAEVRSGSFTGVQFHPEKSGAAGARYLASCLSRG